ncbi:5218_t:CDS:2 [Funneliformis caledonium]|uniref:5218_t:CDS:1 n=1 Tax=Funneliformis caledonium TaxID=1117310 RepID=A0A9N9A1U9_9GLOM|nr:5218_t:CDS:2 [Funneliformis caledonium]
MELVGLKLVGTVVGLELVGTVVGLELVGTVVGLELVETLMLSGVRGVDMGNNNNSK